MGNKFFAFGINGIKALGIPNWSRDFFWPVTFEEFQHLYNRIWECFEYVRDTGDEEIADIVESCCKLAISFTLIAHLQMVSNRLKDKELTFDIDNVLSKHLEKMRESWAFEDTLKINSFKKYLSVVKHSLKTNLTLGIYPSNGLVTNIGGICNLKRSYLRKNKLFGVYNPPQMIIGKFDSTDYSSRQGMQIKRIVDILMEQIIEKLGSLDICLSKNVINHLHSITLSSYLTFGALLEQAKKNISKWDRKVILSGGIGNPVHRAILLANSRTGGHSIGVSHGNYVGLNSIPLYHRLELSCVNEFLVPTEGAKCSLLSIIKQNKALKDIKTQITAVHDDIYKKHWKSNKSKPVPSKIKKVMYLGFPFVDYRDLEYPESFTPIQVDFEYRVLSLLKGRYYVIYKAHPDRLKESDNGRVWADLVDRIETRRFEEVYDEADVYIFGSTGTTTFCFTFPTKKRIIFFDTGHKIYEEEARKLMLKRAIAIKAWFDERNRLMFDEQQLLEALAKKPDEPNTEFIEKYMFPRKS